MEPLKLVIEADASGLKTQFTNIYRNIESLVGQINGQTVDWAKILSGAISPAIITGIAGMFATAIASAIDFQQAVTTTNDTSSQAFLANADVATQAAVDISNATGQSASDVYKALGTTTTALGDYATAHALVSEAAKMSLATHIPFLDLVKEFTPALLAWKVSAADTSSTMENLLGISHIGAVPLSDMLDTMAKTGTVLKTAGDNIGEAAGSLEVYSTKVSAAGGTSKDAQTIFEKVGTNLASVATSADNSVIGLGGFNDQIDTVKKSGMGELLDKMDTSLKNMGTSSATIMATNIFGAPTAEIAAKTAQSASGIAKGVSDAAASAADLGKKQSNTLDTTSELSKQWNIFKNLLLGIGQDILPAVKLGLQGLVDVANVIAQAFKYVFDGLAGIPKILDLINSQGAMNALAAQTADTVRNTAELNLLVTKLNADKKAGDKIGVANDLTAASVINGVTALSSLSTAPQSGPNSSSQQSSVSNIINYIISSTAVSSAQGASNAATQGAKTAAAFFGYSK